MSGSKRGPSGHSAKLAKEAKREEDFFAEKRRIDAANVAKTARLRALRLAKEAADREAAAAQPAPVPARAKKPRAKSGAFTKGAGGKK